MNVNGNNAAQKAHNVKFTPIKAGVRKTDIKDPKLQSIFRQHDLNNNGILEENEAFRLNNSLEKLSKGRVNQQAVNNFAGQEQQNKFNVADLMNLVGQLGQASTAIASCVTNSQNQISVTYNPTEAGTLTENFNQETGNLESNQIVKDNVTTMNNFTMVDGIENPVKTDTTIITMDPNNPQNTTPLTVENQSWTLPEGATEPVMTEKTVLDNTTGTETTTHFSEDGQTVLGTTIKKGTQTTELDAQGRTVSNTNTLPNGMGEEVTTYEYADGSDKPVKETTTSPLKGTVTREIDGDNETVTTEKDGKKTVDKYENGVKKSQTYTDKNGITYEVEYTASGNTKLKAFGPNGETRGFFVQSGENIAKLAKQCGFDSVDEFKATLTNRKGEATTKFNVNNSFEMKGQVSAEDAAAFANSRKTMEMNRDQGNAAEIKRQETVKAQEQANEETEQNTAKLEELERKQTQSQQKGAYLAQRMFDNMKGVREAADQHTGVGGSDNAFSYYANEINSDNAAEVMTNFRTLSPGESLPEAILDEKTMKTSLRTDTITKLFRGLQDQGKALGYSEEQLQKYEAQFDAAMKEWSGQLLGANYKGFDFMEDIAKDIQLRQSNEIFQMRSEMSVSASYSDQQNTVINRLGEDLSYAKNILDHHDMGTFASIANASRNLLGYAISSDQVEAEMNNYKAALQRIQSADETQVTKVFFEEFGVEYSETNIQKYEEARQQYFTATALTNIADEFDLHMDHYLSADNLMDVVKMENPEYYRNDGTSCGLMGGVLTSYKESTIKVMSDRIASAIGGGDTEIGMNYIKQQCSELNMNWDDMTPEDQFKVLQGCARFQSEFYRTQIDKITGGQTLEQMSKGVQDSYHLAYGTKHDVINLVNDYCISVDAAGNRITTALKTVAAIGVMFIPGVGPVASGLIVVGADLAIDAIDKRGQLDISDFGNAALDGVITMTTLGSAKFIGKMTNVSKTMQTATTYTTQTTIKNTGSLVSNGGEISTTELMLNAIPGGKTKAMKAFVKGGKWSYSTINATLVAANNLSDTDRKVAQNYVTQMQQHEEQIKQLQDRIKRNKLEGKDTSGLYDQLEVVKASSGDTISNLSRILATCTRSA